MVGRVAVTGQYLMTDFKKQANIQMSPNDEGYVFIQLSHRLSLQQERHLVETNNNPYYIFLNRSKPVLTVSIMYKLNAL